MTHESRLGAEPQDLVISRRVRAPRAALWRAWTDPDLLKQWWCPKPWTTEVRAFELRPGVSNEDIRLLLARRKATQPIGEWSCGSVFTNPPGDHAARLIDTAGLKGHRIGGARVSEMHANFIVNDGTASAADIEQLIGHVMTTVERVHGVQLKPEVRIVGAGR